MLASFASIALAKPTYPNEYKNTHAPLSIYYYGYVQVQPSYNDGGYHAANGYIRYQRKNNQGVVVKDSVRQYTAMGQDANDGRIYSKNYTFVDTIIPFQPKTQFFYGFTWVPHGSSDWPA